MSDTTVIVDVSLTDDEWASLDRLTELRVEMHRAALRHLDLVDVVAVMAVCARRKERSTECTSLALLSSVVEREARGDVFGS